MSTVYNPKQRVPPHELAYKTLQASLEKTSRECKPGGPVYLELEKELVGRISSPAPALVLEVKPNSYAGFTPPVVVLEVESASRPESVASPWFADPKTNGVYFRREDGKRVLPVILQPQSEVAHQPPHGMSRTSTAGSQTSHENIWAK